MPRILPVAVVLLLSATLAAQQKIKVSTASVPVYTTVFDGTKHLVPDLEQDDFEILDRGNVVFHLEPGRSAIVEWFGGGGIDFDGAIEVGEGALVVQLLCVGDATVVVGRGQGRKAAAASFDEGRTGFDPHFGRGGAVAQFDVSELPLLRFLRRRGRREQNDQEGCREMSLQHPRQTPRPRSALRCRPGGAAGVVLRFRTLSLPSSISVANLTVPSSDISM